MPRILVVEDDHHIAELIRHYLAKAGHRVEVRASETSMSSFFSANWDLVGPVLFFLASQRGLIEADTARTDRRTAPGERFFRVAGIRSGGG